VDVLDDGKVGVVFNQALEKIIGRDCCAQRRV